MNLTFERSKCIGKDELRSTWNARSPRYLVAVSVRALAETAFVPFRLSYLYYSSQLIPEMLQLSSGPSQSDGIVDTHHNMLDAALKSLALKSLDRHCTKHSSTTIPEVCNVKGTCHRMYVPCQWIQLQSVAGTSH